jgi:hypothetical protein
MDEEVACPASEAPGPADESLRAARNPWMYLVWIEQELFLQFFIKEIYLYI